MKHFAVLVLSFVCTAVCVVAAPRFAIVRVNEIYQGLPASKELQQEVNQKRADILKDERAIQLTANLQQMKEMQAQVRKPEVVADKAATEQMVLEFEELRRQTAALQQDFESFRAERNKQINREMVEAMRFNLNQITEFSAKLAKEKGYDVIFDGTGNTNTGVPFVIYSKSAPDLTDDVIAALQDANSAPPVEKANR